MTTEPIDIHDPLIEICNRLGLTYNHVAGIFLTPSALTATVFLPGAHGRPRIDTKTGRIAQEIKKFRVTT